MTTVGPVSVTVTIGGVSAPRHAQTVHEILSRAQETLDRAKAKRPGSFFAYQPNIEREKLRQDNIRSAEKIVTALNDRRILLAYEPLVDTQNRQTAFYECLLRIQHADGIAHSGERDHSGGGAARSRAAARSPRAGTRRDRTRIRAGCQRELQRVACVHH